MRGNTVEDWVNVLAHTIPWTCLVLVGAIALIYSERGIYEEAGLKHQN